MIVKKLRELYVSLGGDENEANKAVTKTQILNLISELLGGDSGARRISEAITNIIPVMPTGGGDIDALIDRSITEISNDTVTNVGLSAFNGCSYLTVADFPNVTTLSQGAFSRCAALTSLNFPNLTRIGTDAFRYCPKLTNVNFPKVTYIDDYGLGNCSALTTVDFSAITGISSTAFRDSTSLTTVILRNESQIMNIPSGAKPFSNTPIANGTGYIYVPDDLVDDYKAASGWSTYAAQIKPISELPTETGD